MHSLLNNIVTSRQLTPQAQYKSLAARNIFIQGSSLTWRILLLDWPGRRGYARQSLRPTVLPVYRGGASGPHTEILILWPGKGPRYQYLQKPPGGILKYDKN